LQQQLMLLLEFLISDCFEYILLLPNDIYESSGRVAFVKIDI
jgi:hypothetical protein